MADTSDNAGQNGVKPEWITHVTTMITWEVTHTAFPNSTFRYVQTVPGEYTKSDFNPAAQRSIVSIVTNQGRVETTDKSFNKCISGTQCGAGYECVKGRCQPVTECSGMIPNCSDFCINETVNYSENEPTCGVGDPNSTYTKGCDGNGEDSSKDPSKEPDCSKFCDEWSKLSSVLGGESSIKDCKTDDACPVCKTCYKGGGTTYSGLKKDGLCVNMTNENRPCYCPSYIDESSGRYVDTQTGKDCQLCDTQQGNWYTPDDETGICSKYCVQTMVCDCGISLSVMAKSKKGGDEACALARKILTKKCNKDCEPTDCPYEEGTCNFQPVEIGKTPLINYPCPKGWNCFSSNDSRLGPAPEGQYYYYSCAYPGWPGITYAEYRDEPGCDACGNNCRNVTVATDGAEPQCDEPLCRIVGFLDTGEGKVMWQLRRCDDNSGDDIPEEEKCFPENPLGRYTYIYKTESEAYEYFPCSCEEPIGEAVTIPGGIIHKQGVRANWPFNELEEVETCRVSSQTDPGAFVRCAGFGPAALTQGDVCGFGKYDQRRTWRSSGTLEQYNSELREFETVNVFADFDSGESMWTLEYSQARPNINPFGTYAYDGFIDGKPNVVYDVPGIPYSEQPPRCSEEPEPVALIDYDLYLIIATENTFNEIMLNDTYNQFAELYFMNKAWELGLPVGSPPQPLSLSERDRVRDVLTEDKKIKPPSQYPKPTIQGPAKCGLVYGDGLIVELQKTGVSTPSVLKGGRYTIPLSNALQNQGDGFGGTVELFVYGANGNQQFGPDFTLKIEDRGFNYKEGDQLILKGPDLVDAGATFGDVEDLSLVVSEVYNQEVPEELKDKPRNYITTFKARNTDNWRFADTKTQESPDREFKIDSQGVLKMISPTTFPEERWGEITKLRVQAIAKSGRWSDVYVSECTPKLLEIDPLPSSQGGGDPPPSGPSG